MIGKALKGIFKGSIDVKDAFSTATGMLDNCNFTNEERAKYNKDIADSVVEFYKLTNDENTERSKTRRNVTKIIVWNTIVVFWTCLILHFLNYNIDFVLDLIGMFQLGTAFIMVMAFHFGGYYLKQWQGKREIKKK